MIYTFSENEFGFADIAVCMIDETISGRIFFRLDVLLNGVSIFSSPTVSLHFPQADLYFMVLCPHDFFVTSQTVDDTQLLVNDTILSYVVFGHRAHCGVLLTR